MKKTILIASLLMGSMAIAQSPYLTKDTTFLGWNATISYLPGKSDSTNVVVTMHGSGEVGTNVALNKRYGAHYWMLNGWTGVVPMGNGDHYPVQVTLQPPNPSGSGYYHTPTVLNPVLDAIALRFKASSMALGGLSRGGWSTGNYYAYKPAVGNYSYANKLRVIFFMEAQRSDDGYGYPVNTYPQKFGQSARYATSDVRIWACDQINGQGNTNRIIKNMLDSGMRSDRVAFFWTAFGNTGHDGFNEMYNPSQTNWTLTNTKIKPSNGGSINTMAIAPGLNFWQWVYKQFRDTTLDMLVPSAPDPPVQISSCGTQTVTATTTASVVVSVTTFWGTPPFFYEWSRVSGSGGTITSPGSSATSIINLPVGVHVFQCKVTDGAGTTDTATVTITVN